MSTMWFKHSIVAMVVTILISFVTANEETSPSQPIELTVENWKSELIDKHHRIFIKFYSPSCGFCKKLAPTWQTLPSELVGTGVTVAKVDCISPRNIHLCEEFQITHFPILILLEGNKMVKYDGDRSLDDLKRFAIEAKPNQPAPDLTKTVDVNAKPTWREDSDVIVVTDHNYAQVFDGDAWLLEFYADWCPFCQKAIPVVEDVASILKGKAKVGRINTRTEHGLKKAFGVKGIPQFKLIRDGKYYSMEYHGQTSEEFVEFVEGGWRSHKAEEIPQPDKIKVTYWSSLVDFVTNYATSEFIQGTLFGTVLLGMGIVIGRCTAGPHAKVKRI